MSAGAARLARALVAATSFNLGCATSFSAQEHQHAAHQDQRPREPIPSLTDADRAAAFPPIHAGHPAHDIGTHVFIGVDELEARAFDEGTGFAWEVIGWVGRDVARAWLRTHGERLDGRTEAADLELLAGRAIAPWWDLVAGVRHDVGDGPSQTFAGVGVIGLAPYKFEIEAGAYLGESGQTTARLKAEYELLLTNRLILKPLVQADAYGETDVTRGIGSGLSTIEAGARLRYELTRRFAPYVGVTYERAFSGTADLRRAGGYGVEETVLVAGLRTWF